MRKQAGEAAEAGNQDKATALKAEAAKWDEGGAYRIALHTTIGALGGGIDGALGAGTVAAGAPLLNGLQDQVTQALVNAGIGDTAAKLAGQLIAQGTAAGVGAAVSGGSVAGAAAAFGVDTNNRQLHFTEAQKLASLKQGKTAEEQRRLDAAACALARCADGIPPSDPQYAKLQAMQTQGQGYTSEQKMLLATGEFVYQPLDTARDFLTRNAELVTRAGGAANLLGGVLGTIGGGAIATGGVLSCPETGVGCALVPLGGYIAGVSNQQAQQGNQALTGLYQSSEGQRVLDSFNLATYPGERDPLAELGIDTARLGLVLAMGKYIPKTLAKAEGLTPTTIGAKGSGTLAEGELAASKVKWVDENAGMSQAARDYNDSATGARSNPITQSGQAPALERIMPDGTTRQVKFDGVDGDVMVDRKISVVTTDKAKDQALRQSEALSQNGLTGRWEISSEAQAARATKMLNDLGIKNIQVKVVKP